jgi:hypothetical protein
MRRCGLVLDERRVVAPIRRHSARSPPARTRGLARLPFLLRALVRELDDGLASLDAAGIHRIDAGIVIAVTSPKHEASQQYKHYFYSFHLFSFFSLFRFSGFPEAGYRDSGFPRPSGFRYSVIPGFRGFRHSAFRTPHHFSTTFLPL